MSHPYQNKRTRKLDAIDEAEARGCVGPTGEKGVLCARPVAHLLLCAAHYQQLARGISPLRPLRASPGLGMARISLRVNHETRAAVLDDPPAARAALEAWAKNRKQQP